MLQRYLGRMRSSQFQPGQSGLDGGLLAVWRISSKGSTPNRGRPAANQQISTEPQQGGRKRVQTGRDAPPCLRRRIRHQGVI